MGLADLQGWSCKFRAGQPLADDPPRLYLGGEVLRLLPSKAYFQQLTVPYCFRIFSYYFRIYFVLFAYFELSGSMDGCVGFAHSNP